MKKLYIFCFFLLHCAIGYSQDDQKLACVGRSGPSGGSCTNVSFDIYENKKFFAYKESTGPAFLFRAVKQIYNGKTIEGHYIIESPGLGTYQTPEGKDLSYRPEPGDVNGSVTITAYHPYFFGNASAIDYTRILRYEVLSTLTATVEIPEVINTEQIRILSQADAPIILASHVKSGISGITFTLDNANITKFDPAQYSPGTYTIIAKKAYDNGTWTQNINVTVMQGTAEIRALGPTTFCDGGEVYLTANDPPNSTITYQYLWSTGETTKEIKVKNTGEYFCTVKYGISSVTSNKINVNVIPLPTAQIIVGGNGQTIVCEGQTVQLNGPINPSGQNYTYSWSSGETSQSIIARYSGIYTLTVKNGDCLKTSQSVTVTFLPKPYATVTVQGGTEICEGKTTTLVASTGDNYVWYDELNIPVGTLQTLSVSRTGTYKVVITNNNGCSAESSPVTIVVKPNPKPRIEVTGSLTLCEGEQTILTCKIDGIPRNITWSNGMAGQNITVKEAGIYTVTVENEGGCPSQSDPIQILVKPNPKPQIMLPGGVTEICLGESVTMTSTPANSYLWSTGETTQTITAQVAGSYYVTITNPNGCTSTSERVSITVRPNVKPVIMAFGPTNFCQGESVKLTVSNPQANTTYAWSNGQSGVEATLFESGNYYVLATNQNGCSTASDVTPVTVINIPKPTVSTSTDPNICDFSSVILHINETGAAYRWNSGETTRDIVVTAPGTYIAYITSGNGCERASDPVTVTVKNNRMVTVTRQGTTSFCEGKELILTASEGASYLWSDGVTTRTRSVTQSGVYNVTVTNNVGCTATSEDIPVTVYPLPKPTITLTGSASFCEGQSSILTINETGAAYRWSNGESTKSITVTRSGTYKAYLINSEGCERESEVISISVSANPVPLVIASGPIDFCEGSSVKLTVTNIQANTTYNWSNGLTGAEITVNQGGNYFVTAVTNGGCSRTSVLTAVTVFPISKPTISVQGGNSICQGQQVKLSIQESGVSYRWNTGATTKDIIISETGTFQAFIINAQGCERASEPVVITVLPNPIPLISASGPLTFCEGGSVSLSINAIAGSTYKWNTGAVGSSIDVSSSGTYFVTATTAQGCVNISASVNVVVHAIPKPTIIVEGNNTICEGERVTLTIGETANNYRWSEGSTTKSINVTRSGIFQAFITNAQGCERASDPIVITVKPNPQPMIRYSTPLTFCQGESVVLSAPSGMSSYMWSTGENTPQITVTSSKKVSVTATNTEGCTNTSNELTVTVLPNAKPTVTIKVLKLNTQP